MSVPNDPQQPPNGGAPGYGNPGPYAGPESYGYPPGYNVPPVPYGGYAVPRPTNGMSIAALVCSLAGLAICVSAPVGLVLGFVALSQIKRTHEEGRGLAIAAIWVGGIQVAIGVFVAMLFFGLVAFSPGW